MSREQELEAARNEMVKTFWYVTKCCEGPYLGRPMMDGPFPSEINTKDKAMKMMLDHILEVASTMVDRYSTDGFKRFVDMWDQKK
jgi:hypothetical protein